MCNYVLCDVGELKVNTGRLAYSTLQSKTIEKLHIICKNHHKNFIW